VHFLCNVLGGGLKDAEALFMNVGDGTPPPAAPQATDPQGVRAALLQRMWLRMAENEEEDEGSVEDEEGYEAEGVDDESGEDAASAEGAAQRAQIQGGGASHGDEDDDDDWEKEGSAAGLAAGAAALRLSALSAERTDSAAVAEQ
jgi:hypothetical protein